MSAILVTGTDNHLAPEILQALASGGFEVVDGTADQPGADVRRACEPTVRKLRPLVVVDCTFAEHATDGGAADLAAAAADVGALSVYLSSADVYDGLQERPYVESDVPAPATEHGAGKLEAERAVAQANPRHAIVRTSPWLFGTRRPSFADELLEGARSGDRLPVDNSVRSTPMYADHVVGALVGFVRRPAYGVFHVAGGGRCTKLQFARTLFRALGIACQPVPEVRDGAMSATQPNVVLDTRRTNGLRIPDWRLGLAAYLSESADATRPIGSRTRLKHTT